MAWKAKFLQYHIVISECILHKAHRYVLFDSSQSRWGLISLLLTCVQFCIAAFLAFYGLYISFATYYEGDWTDMSWWMILIFILAILFGAIGFFGFIFTLWIGTYFIRKPSNPTIEPNIEQIKGDVSKITARLDNIEAQIQMWKNKDDQEKLHTESRTNKDKLV